MTEMEDLKVYAAIIVGLILIIAMIIVIFHTIYSWIKEQFEESRKRKFRDSLYTPEQRKRKEKTNMNPIKSYWGCLAVLFVFIGGYIVLRFGAGEEIGNQSIKTILVIIGLIIIFGGPGLAYSLSGQEAEDKEREQLMSSVKRTRSRTTTSDYPQEWNEISMQVKRRDGYQCGNCGSSSNLHVHHIVPRSKGGTDNLSNLRTLCEVCHKLLHPHMKN